MYIPLVHYIGQILNSESLSQYETVQLLLLVSIVTMVTAVSAHFTRYLSVECHEDKNTTIKEKFKFIRAKFLSELYHVSFCHILNV